MHVKIGDTVKIISGRDKGKTGEIFEIFKHNSTIKVRDINLKTKHVKSKGEDEPGKIMEVFFAAPLIFHVNVFFCTIMVPTR